MKISSRITYVLNKHMRRIQEIRLPRRLLEWCPCGIRYKDRSWYSEKTWKEEEHEILKSKYPSKFIKLISLWFLGSF